MAVKYVVTVSGFLLRETSYTEEATNIYRKYSAAKKGKTGFGRTDKLLKRMRKTEPRGKVFRRLIKIKAQSVLGE